MQQLKELDHRYLLPYPITIRLTQSRILLEKLTVTALVKNSPQFMDYDSKSPPLVLILSQKTSVHTITLYLTLILILSSHPNLYVPNGLVPFVSRLKF
jgi:hypothetical protein